MGFVKGVYIIFLSVLIIFLLLFLSYGLVLYSLLYPEIYQESFEHGEIYTYIDNNVINSSGAVFIKIPEEGSKPIIDNALANILAYIRSDSDTINLTVEIDQEKLKGFFIQSIENASICQGQVNPFIGEEINCRPAGITSEEFLNEILKRKNLTFFEKNTTDLTFVFGLEEGSEGMDAINKVRNFVHNYKIALYIMILLLIFTIILLITLEINSPKFMLRILGIDIIIVGIIIIISAILLSNYTYLITETGSKFINQVIEIFALNFIKRINYYGITMLALGIALSIISLFVRAKD